MGMTENKRFTYENHKVKDNLTGEVHSSNMVSVNVLNALHEENQELRLDNDIKFWKHQFMKQYNENQFIIHELNLAINEGYEVSDKFKKWIDDLRERNKEVMAKHERLFE